MTINAPKATQLTSLWDLWKNSFGDSDEFIECFRRTAFSDRRCRCISIGDETVASLYWFDCTYLGERVAYIYAVSTAEEYRGRGLGKKLMEDTHEHLAQSGYAGAILVPSSPSLFEFYRNLGYATCSEIREFTRLAEKAPIYIEEITAGEYTRLRKSLLPYGSVIQENESIDFLNTQARLYKGEDFILAAKTQGQTLCGAELLGNTECARRIVSALGCYKGEFRTAGLGRPFAMYLPLKNYDSPAPSYFGLAFD